MNAISFPYLTHSHSTQEQKKIPHHNRMERAVFWVERKSKQKTNKTDRLIIDSFKYF